MASDGEQLEHHIYRALSRAIYLAAGIGILFWFLYEILGILLLFLFALIFAIVLNAPVTWLEEHKVPRVAGTLLTMALVLLLVAFLGWLIIPELAGQIGILVNSIPDYATRLAYTISSALGDYPAIEKHFRLDAETLSRIIPSIPKLLGRIGRYSFSILQLLLLGIVLFSMVIYMVAKPRPLLAMYITALPPGLRDRGARALARASEMVIGWIWANVLVGGLEAVAAGIFLSIMGMPIPLVWAALAFFAELVPKLGLYLMAIPPILVALSIDPFKALWVAIFYIALNESMGDFVMPRIRSTTMSLHPVSTLFVMLAMASAFGVLGALIATPLAGFIKAYYDEFYLSRYPEDPLVEKRIDTVLTRRTSRSGS
jgi:putative permease